MLQGGFHSAAILLIEAFVLSCYKYLSLTLNLKSLQTSGGSHV